MGEAWSWKHRDAKMDERERESERYGGREGDGRARQ